MWSRKKAILVEWMLIWNCHLQSSSDLVINGKVHLLSISGTTCIKLEKGAGITAAAAIKLNIIHQESSHVNLTMSAVQKTWLVRNTVLGMTQRELAMLKTLVEFQGETWKAGATKQRLKLITTDCHDKLWHCLDLLRLMQIFNSAMLTSCT